MVLQLLMFDRVEVQAFSFGMALTTFSVKKFSNSINVRLDKSYTAKLL